MTTYGLSSTGFLARRAADFRQIMRDYYDAATGLVNDWSDDTFLGNITANASIRLGELSEGLQAVYDAFNRNGATGAQLDDIGGLIGVFRNEATYSLATVTLSGTAGTVIPSSNVVEGGGDDGRARWKTLTDATIGGGGTVDVQVQAEEAGSIHADIGDIDKIVTPVSGWDSVTNAAESTDGQDRETDDEYKLRQSEGGSIYGSGNSNSLLANLSALDYVAAALVIDNDEPTQQVIGGVTVPPNSSTSIIWPNSLTDAQKDEVAETIYMQLPQGIKANGADVTRTVTKRDGLSKSISFSWASQLGCTTDVTVELEPGYVLTDVDTPIEEANEALFALLTVGESIQDLDLQGQIASVAGLKRATVTFNIGAGAVTSAEPDFNEILNLTSTTVHL